MKKYKITYQYIHGAKEIKSIITSSVYEMSGALSVLTSKENLDRLNVLDVEKI